MDVIAQIVNLLNVVALGIAIYQLKQTAEAAKAARTASERAEAAAKNVQSSMVLATSIADCAAAIGMMDEIKSHLREIDWSSLPSLCSNLKRKLVSIRAGNDHLSKEQELGIQNALTHFTTMEGQIERHLAGQGNSRPPNVPKLNGIVSRQIDHVHALLIALQRSIRKQDHGGQ